MRYDYTCPVCGNKEERNVPVDERDNQFCSCWQATTNQLDGSHPEPVLMMRENNFSGVVIGIPDCFTASDALGDDDILPSSAAARKTWDECGVHVRGKDRWV